MGEQIWSPGSHNIRPRGPVHLIPVGCPLQLAQHPAQADHCLPPAVQQGGRTLPPPPEGQHSTSRHLAGQLRCSPPTAMVVVGFVQPYKPMVESSSSAHTTGPASTRAASKGPASAGPASTGPVSAGPVSAARERTASAAADVKLPSGLSAAPLSAGRTAGKQNPAQLKAAYSCLLDEFEWWSALQSGYRRSDMMSSTTWRDGW
jgi:hypothetical protein